GIDTSAPAAGAITAISDDNGVSNTDFITNDNTLLINGTGEAGAMVEVFIDGVSVGMALVDGSGNWTFDYTGTALGDGTYALTTEVTDPAGNTSVTSAPVPLVIDTSAPAAPVINVPTNGDPVTGTGEPGATVTVTTGSSGSCTALVQPDGSWSCTLSGPITDGDDIFAEQDDPAGNTSPQTTELG
ncbi:Ig-like domain-containing protein, partial [Marinicella sediminis]